MKTRITTIRYHASISVLLCSLIILLIHRLSSSSTTASITNYDDYYVLNALQQGYVSRITFGTDEIIRRDKILIQMGNKDRIVEIFTEKKVSDLTPFSSLNIEAYLVGPNNDTDMIRIEPLLIDESTFAEMGMNMYRFNLTIENSNAVVASRRSDGAISEFSLSDEYSRIIVLNTTQKLTWFEMGSAHSDDRFFASRSNKLIKPMQFFLGAITYSFMFVWILCLIVISIVYWFIKEKGKKYMAAGGELNKKRIRQIVLISFGLVLCFIGIVFTIVVAFFTKRDTQDVCCVYFKRRFNSNQIPIQSYNNNCKYISFLNEEKKIQEYQDSCFAQESFMVKYTAHIWWWLLLCGTVPGLILYTAGHICITIGIYKLLRLIKKQHETQSVTKFKVGFQN